MTGSGPRETCCSTTGGNDEVNYLLRDMPQPANCVAPTANAVHVVLSEIQTGLQKIMSDTSAMTDPTGESRVFTAEVKSHPHLAQPKHQGQCALGLCLRPLIIAGSRILGGVSEADPVPP